MTLSRLALGLALANAVAISAAYAQGVRQPTQPAAYEFEYYAPQAAAPSPSDKAVAPAPAAPAAPAAEIAPSCDSCNTCDTCDSCGSGHSCGCPLDCPEACEAWKLFDCCCLKEREINMEGWIEVGVTANADDPADRWNGVNGFNDRNEVQMNQLYWFAQKSLPTDNCGWAIGGRVDLMYGTDGRYTQALGLETNQDGTNKWNSERFYQLSMPQLYADIGYGDLQIQIGRMYTLIGYEVIPAPANFFYSHAYCFLFAEPFTHTGVQFTKPLNDEWKVSAGFNRGWDKWTDDNDKLNFSGAVTWTSSNDGKDSVVVAVTTGDEFAVNGFDGNRTMYSIVWTHKFNDRFSYVLQHDWGKQDQGNGDDANWYGINNYLFYQLSCNWWFGTRLEWFRDVEGTRVAGLGDGATQPTNSNPASSGGFAGNFYEYTFGLNYKPLHNPNLVVRPEVRWDVYNGVGNPYDGGTKQDQFTFAIDAIIKF